MVRITESKLDETVFGGEINIDGYELVRSGRNRHGGGVACYIRSDVSFNPIRPGLFSHSPGPGEAQRPRCQKSRLTSTN